MASANFARPLMGTGNRPTELPFPWFLALGLTEDLPLRRLKLFGPKVCERVNVIPVEKTGFLLGGALALFDRGLAESILGESMDWNAGSMQWILDFERRLMNSSEHTTTWEEFFPEVLEPHLRFDANHLQTVEMCRDSIANRVILGLMFGVLFPVGANSMVTAWGTHDGGWSSLPRDNQPPASDALTRSGVSPKDRRTETAKLAYTKWKEEHPVTGPPTPSSEKIRCLEEHIAQKFFPQFTNLQTAFNGLRLSEQNRDFQGNYRTHRSLALIHAALGDEIEAENRFKLAVSIGTATELETADLRETISQLLKVRRRLSS